MEAPLLTVAPLQSVMPGPCQTQVTNKMGSQISWSSLLIIKLIYFSGYFHRSYIEHVLEVIERRLKHSENPHIYAYIFIYY